MASVIESLCVLQGAVVCTGYSNVGPPSLYYDGLQVAAIHVSVERPDLVASFGAEAAGWGFRLCALPPIAEPEHARIAVRFLGGELRSHGRFSVPTETDREYQALCESFRTETDRGGRLLEIGSRARSGNVYKSLFSDKVEYTGLDVTDGPNVDVVADAHHMSRHLDGTFDFAFSISVFEHLLMPWKVALELAQVMNMGGVGLIQSHSAFPLHEQPWDFWRYSRDAWRGIFNAHTGFEVLKTAYAGLAWTVPAFATGSAGQNMDRHPNYVLSACLIRKVGDPLVRWDAETSNVYDLDYKHA